MKKIIFLLALLVGLMLLPAVSALSASVGNARMILRPEIAEGETITIDKTILVNNVNNIPVEITVEPHGYYKKIVQVFDDKFILQPNESKKAAFKITLTSGGTYEGKILIGFRPTDNESKEMPIGFSSSIIIIAKGPINDDFYEIVNYFEEETEETEEQGNESKEFTEEEISEEIKNKPFSLDTTTNTDAPETKIKKGEVNPIVGAFIIAFIIVLGVGIFFLVKRYLK